MPRRTWTAASLRQKAAGRWEGIALLPLLAGTFTFPTSLDAGIRWWQFLWLAALAAVFIAALLKGQRSRFTDREASVIMLSTVLLLLSAGVRMSGGFASPFWPGYFIFLAAGTFFFSLWWQQALILAAVLGLELVRLAGEAAPAPPARLAAAAALLGAFQATIHLLFLRDRRRLRQTVAEYNRLQEAAKHFGRREEDRMGPELEAHSTEAKMKRLINAEEELDTHLGRLLTLARRALEAQTVVFLEREGNHFVFRGAAEGGPKVDRKVKIRVGEGHIGGTAKYRKPVLIKNTAKGRNRVRYFRGEGKVASLMSVPVIEEEVVRGILIADHAEEGRFSPGDLGVFEGFAVEVNLLLENSRSSWRDRRSASMETVSAISKSLMSASLSLREILETLVEEVKGEIPYDQCAVFLVDPRSSRLVLHAQRGFLFPKGKRISFPMDEGLPGHILTHGQPLLFSQVKEGQVVPGYTGVEKMRSFMGIPLKFKEELEGVLIFASAELGKFTSYQKEILDILVNQALAQVSNAVLHEKVEKASLTDGLTGLFNHRHFQERLTHELKRADRQNQRVSLLLLDIDHFKSKNDDYGHPFGDEILIGISAKLSELARDIDLVARYGGEEFVVVLGNTGRRDCRNVAERIRKEIEALSFDYQGTAVKTTVSLGGATFPEDGATKEELIRHADQALYHSKHSGRNRFTAFKNVP
jgi:diguanylate cyclase (GGDEF)-like protein